MKRKKEEEKKNGWWGIYEGLAAVFFVLTFLKGLPSPNDPSSDFQVFLVFLFQGREGRVPYDIFFFSLLSALYLVMRGSFKTKEKTGLALENEHLSHNDVHNNARDMTFARRVCICMYLCICMCVYISHTASRGSSHSRIFCG